MMEDFSIEEVEGAIASVEAAFDEHGLKCNDGHWMTKEEFSQLTEHQLISLFQAIYIEA